MIERNWDEIGVKVVSKFDEGITSYGLKVDGKYILRPEYKSISMAYGEINFCTGIVAILKDWIGRCSIFLIKDYPITAETRTKLVEVSKERPEIVTAEYFGKGMFILKDVHERVVTNYQYDGYWG